MNIINIHKRRLKQSKTKIAALLKTLASDNDMMLATEKWPRMLLDNGLQVGSKGGHASIKYIITEYIPEHSITFKFTMQGFNGFHRFNIVELDADKTEISHTIEMKTSGLATLKWAFAIRWLHDAYIEDAFDKIENYFTTNKKRSEWSWWVKTLRRIMKSKKE